MLRSNLKFIFKKLLLYKLLTSIKMSGLIMGITIFFVVFLFAKYELSFDKFSQNRDRIYRLYSLNPKSPEKVVRSIPIPVVSIVQNDFSGVEAVSYFYIL